MKENYCHHLHKHGHRPKSGGSRTYKSWMAMRERCKDKTNPNYGMIGIGYCESWDDFKVFLADMGERPKGTTLDRKDPSLGYSKENCRWATSKTQSRNKKSSVIIEFKGQIKNLVDIATEYGVPKTTIYRRYHQGIRGDDLVCRKNRNRLTPKPSKLSEKQVKDIREMCSEGLSQAVVAKKHNISQTTVSEIVNMKYHKSLV